MSEHEELAAIGHLTKSYEETRKHFALLQTEIAHLVDHMSMLNAAMGEKRFTEATNLLGNSSVTKYFSVDSLRDLLDDARSTEEKLRNIQSQMAASGLL
jgi:hypothetical protein